MFRVAIDAIEASSNGILPAFTAGDNRADFFEPRTGSDFPNFIMPLFTRDDDDFTYALRTLECANCVSDHRFPRDHGEQFVKAHALAATAGDDDGAEHGEYVTS
jgi:hypothetical protein